MLIGLPFWVLTCGHCGFSGILFHLYVIYRACPKYKRTCSGMPPFRRTASRVLYSNTAVSNSSSFLFFLLWCSRGGRLQATLAPIFLLLTGCAATTGLRDAPSVGLCQSVVPYRACQVNPSSVWAHRVGKATLPANLSRRVSHSPSELGVYRSRATHQLR